MISWTENTNELYNEYINCWCWSDQISLPLGVSGSMIDNKKLKCHLFRWEIGTCWGTNINLGSVTWQTISKKNSNQPVRFPVHCLEDSLRWSRLSTFFHCCFTRQKYTRNQQKVTAPPAAGCFKIKERCFTFIHVRQLFGLLLISFIRCLRWDKYCVPLRGKCWVEVEMLSVILGWRNLADGTCSLHPGES